MLIFAGLDPWIDPHIHQQFLSIVSPFWDRPTILTENSIVLVKYRFNKIIAVNLSSDNFCKQTEMGTVGGDFSKLLPKNSCQNYKRVKYSSFDKFIPNNGINNFDDIPIIAQTNKRPTYSHNLPQQENTHTYPIFEFLREIVSTNATTQQQNAHTTYSTRARASNFYES